MVQRPVLDESSVALTFDDVLLVPRPSDVLPGETDVTSRVTREISLKIPILSSAMDTVTEGRLANAEAQAEQVAMVKRYVAGMVVNPYTISPKATLADALRLMEDRKISGVPVVEDGRAGKLLGILTNRDVRFATNTRTPVSELMTKKLVTVKDGVRREDAERLLHQHRIEKLLVVDDDFRCIGLITVKDIEKAQKYPDASKDEQGRLRVAAVDLVVVDTAHGHSKRVLDAVTRIKKQSNRVQVIAGNVATADGTKALIDAGADAVKVGIGPGSICTTRIVAGVGVPQLTAIMDAVEAAKNQDVPIIADGGIKFSGDIVKALAAGADCVMVGALLAGTDEAPGETYLYQGRTYKAYRGMGSVGAMARGSADRYFQQEVKDTLKLVPEGIEGQVPYKGPVDGVLHQLVGGLRAGMGYIGAANLTALRERARFVRISPAGGSEGHTHGVAMTREAPNYTRSV